jgi:RNA polymerase sigma-70 factor (ECF subfamily)
MDGDVTRSLDLLRRAQDGEGGAVDQLFGRYYERVRRIVRMRIGPVLRKRVDSGDILQETFIAALESFDRFEVRDEASFISWLARIAQRQVFAAVDHHSAQKRDAGRDVPLVHSVRTGAVGIDPAADGMSPLEELSHSEQTSLVEDCIAELPEPYRELIILRDYAGGSWELIAEETGRPSAAAARMMHAKALIELGKLVRDRTDDAG